MNINIYERIFLIAVIFIMLFSISIISDKFVLKNSNLETNDDDLIKMMNTDYEPFVPDYSNPYEARPLFWRK